MTRPSLHRPTLLPGLPRIWRGVHTLQLGLDPAYAVLVDLPDPVVAHLLDLLDGTRPERAIVQAAADMGISLTEATTLLDVLHEAGLVVPAQRLLPPTLDVAGRRLLSGEATALALRPPRLSRRPPSRGLTASPASLLRKRHQAKVVVAGRSRLAAGVAVALAQAGVGHVHADLSGTVTDEDRITAPLPAAAVGTPRVTAVPEAVEAAAPGTDIRAIRGGNASLIVQFAPDKPVALLALAHLQRRRPYLPVAVREAITVIGPLVPATGRPCLNCLVLHRNQRTSEALRLLPPFSTARPVPAPSRSDPDAMPPPGASASPVPASARFSDEPPPPIPMQDRPVDSPPDARGPAQVVGSPPPPAVWPNGHTAMDDPYAVPNQRPGQEPLSVAGAWAAVGHVVAEALMFLDGGEPESLGAEIEIWSPGRVRRRSWAAHPHCACAAPRRRL
ncbi:hypothetical protein [Actinoplanes sp. RD1]|uniref:hypothetical protein n=1 Tax=Actinoplanes sp. RD1 TaxID=3064538 RepID=UPI0027419525|nr:hypothetical protein [Actinoplanes sp. RD1]